MSNVWLTCPAARPEEQSTVPLWSARGYKTALWRDPGAPPIKADLIIMGEYPGHSVSNNRLIKTVLELDPTCDWCVSAGDDVEPDLNHSPSGLARECEEHFGLYISEFGSGLREEYLADVMALESTKKRSTFGVMQPTGDRWLEDHYRAQFPDEPAHIDRICGSPWIGREFARRAYHGNGPWWPEFWHMYNDEHLQAVSKKLGILWQRRDLSHMHNHWARKPRPTEADMPDFLKRANSPENWNAMKAIFDRLKSGDFAEAYDLLPAAGSEPCE